ncbi:MAG: glycosyltransferase family 2 protein [Actinomycetota bacterium]|nr:glycosyltransferase family 2 protein [Actinomycetota bacterium]
MSGPAVAVVVPARNAEPTLSAAVASALAQEVEGGLEVCIAVGPSVDGTAEVARGLAQSDQRVLVVENPTGVTPAGLNLAIRATSAPVVVRLDAHAVLDPGYVARAVEILERTGAVNVGGRQDPRGVSPFEKAVGAAMSSRFAAGDARFRTGGPPGPVDTVYLGVFSRAALEGVDLFDEELVRNQDSELNWRLRQAGGEVYFDPSLVVGYRPRSALRTLGSQYFGYGRWRRVVVRRHPRSVRWRQLLPPVVLCGVGFGLVSGWFWMPLFLFPAVYGVAVMAASVVVGNSPSQIIRLVSVFPVIHMSWAVGFLIGYPARSGGRRT